MSPWWRAIESFLGLFGALLISVLMVGVAAVIYTEWGRPGWIAEIVRWLIILGIIGAEGHFLIDVHGFYNRRKHPFVLLYALRARGPGFPLFAFPLSVWWIAHAAMAILAAVWFDERLTFAMYGASTADIAVDYVTLSVVVFAASHASLLHLLLAIRSSGAAQHVVRQVWPWRVLIDVAIVLITVLSVDPRVPLGDTRVGQILRNFGVNV